jgi:hypothetical protein
MCKINDAICIEILIFNEFLSRQLKVELVLYLSFVDVKSLKKRLVTTIARLKLQKNVILI